MDLMINPVITDFRQDVNGDIKMLKLGTNKEDAYANIIGQAEGAKLDNNKTATINVSTYTEPVVINPTSGKDGMKKCTVTLSNIPSEQSLYIWSFETGSYSVILPVGTFAEITVGMEGIGCTPSSENMFSGTITAIGEDSATFKNEEETLSITISSADTATAFPSLS